MINENTPYQVISQLYADYINKNANIQKENLTPDVIRFIKRICLESLSKENIIVCNKLQTNLKCRKKELWLRSSKKVNIKEAIIVEDSLYEALIESIVIAISEHLNYMKKIYIDYSKKEFLGDSTTLNNELCTIPFKTYLQLASNQHISESQAAEYQQLIPGRIESKFKEMRKRQHTKQIGNLDYQYNYIFELYKFLLIEYNEKKS